MKACAFAGYRHDLFDFPDDDGNTRFQALQKVIRRQIIALFYEGYDFFISGMSTGAGMWCAEDVLWLQQSFPSLKLICAIPFFGQEVMWRGWYQKEYNHILSYSYKQVVISPSIEASADINQYYLARNRWMVDHSDRLIAIYSDDTAPARSGSRMTVQYARRKGCKIIYIHPITFEVSKSWD